MFTVQQGYGNINFGITLNLMSSMFCQSIYVFAAFPTSDIIFTKPEPDRNYFISPCDVDHMLDILALFKGEAHL